MMVKLLLRILVVVSLTSDVVLTVMAMPAQTRQRRSDDAGPLEPVVQQLAQQVNSLSAQLTQQANSFTAQLSHLKDLTERLNKTVAFYAWHSHNPIHTTAHGTLIMDHAQTNIGNGYNTLTGVFTVPVSGLYHFQTTFLCYALGQFAHAGIYVDGNLMAVGISDSRHNFYDPATISSTLHVNAGQQVYVGNPDSTPTDYYDNLENPHTTFSGFLIRAD